LSVGGQTFLETPLPFVSFARNRAIAQPPADAYAQLKRLVGARGLLERRPSNAIAPVAGILAVLSITVLGLVLTRGGWWALAWAAPAALVFGQLGFLAHDAVHNQIFRTSRANYTFGLVLFNLCLGGSRGWWADKHNIHHAQPNRLGTDPDIEGGVVAVSEEQARSSRGFTRFMIRHQTATIGPLLSLSIMQIHAYSAAFLRDRRLRHPRLELGLVALHYTVYLGGLILLLGVGHGLIFAAVHQLLLGVYLGGAFLPNHVGMTILQPDADEDFLRRQVITARNIRAGRATDYLFGALSCQVEHHLFPAMPRRNLRKAAPIVRRFCAEQGIDYRETSAWEAYRQVFEHLRTVARAAALGSTVAGGKLATPA
jgi:fatty acid desaturase